MDRTYRAVDLSLNEGDRVSLDVFNNTSPAFLAEYEKSIKVTKFDDSIESRFPALFDEAIPRSLGPYTEAVMVATPALDNYEKSYLDDVALEALAVSAVRACSDGDTARARRLVSEFDKQTFNVKILLHPYDYALAHVLVSGSADILAFVLPRIQERMGNDLRTWYYKKYIKHAVTTAAQQSRLADIKYMLSYAEPVLAHGALHEACTFAETQDTVRVVEYILDYIEQKGIHSYDVYKDALKTACQYGKVNVVEYLLGRVSYTTADLKELLTSVAILFTLDYTTRSDTKPSQAELKKRATVARQIKTLLENEIDLLRYIISLDTPVAVEERNCPEGKIYNPQTGRCVDANGRVGRALRKR